MYAECSSSYIMAMCCLLFFAFFLLRSYVTGSSSANSTPPSVRGQTVVESQAASSSVKVVVVPLRSFVRPSVRSFFGSLVRPFVRLLTFARSLVRSFVPSVGRSFARLSVRSIPSGFASRARSRLKCTGAKLILLSLVCSAPHDTNATGYRLVGSWSGHDLMRYSGDGCTQVHSTSFTGRCSGFFQWLNIKHYSDCAYEYSFKYRKQQRREPFLAPIWSRAPLQFPSGHHFYGWLGDAPLGDGCGRPPSPGEGNTSCYLVWRMPHQARQVLQLGL